MAVEERLTEAPQGALAARLPGPEVFEVGLSEVDRRRTQLWTVSLFIVAALTIFIAVLAFGGGFLPEELRLRNMSTWVVGVLVGGLMLAFLIYVVEKEASLRRLSMLLVEERVRSASLSTRLTELSVLAEITKGINSTLKVKDVFDLLLSSALKMLGGDRGFVMMLDERSGVLDVVSYNGPAEENPNGYRIFPDESLVGAVGLNGLPRLLQADELTRKQLDDVLLKRMNSAMCVPLTRRGELTGILGIVDTKSRKPYTELDLHALEFFSESSAVAIANARLFEKEGETIARLQELDHMRSDFVATVSHELKTPLAAIIGAAKTIGSRGTRMNEEQLETFLGMIERQGNRLLRLVQDLLTASRIESGLSGLRREHIDLRELADGAIADVLHSRSGREQDVVLLCDPEKPHVWGDPTGLYQILTNLVENALKYSEDGSKVTVTLIENDVEVQMIVADKGQGIAPEELAAVFERFMQADSMPAGSVAGFGLGLYIVKNLVELHRGKVEVASDAGRGSTFTIRFPTRGGR
jgi:two-component system, OmpR family, sensor histidine kinase KdpD